MCEKLFFCVLHYTHGNLNAIVLYTQISQTSTLVKSVEKATKPNYLCLTTVTLPTESKINCEKCMVHIISCGIHPPKNYCSLSLWKDHVLTLQCKKWFINKVNRISCDTDFIFITKQRLTEYHFHNYAYGDCGFRSQYSPWRRQTWRHFISMTSAWHHKVKWIIPSSHSQQSWYGLATTHWILLKQGKMDKVWL